VHGAPSAPPSLVGPGLVIADIGFMCLVCHVAGKTTVTSGPIGLGTVLWTGGDFGTARAPIEVLVSLGGWITKGRVRQVGRIRRLPRTIPADQFKSFVRKARAILLPGGGA